MSIYTVYIYKVSFYPVYIYPVYISPVPRGDPEGGGSGGRSVPPAGPGAGGGDQEGHPGDPGPPPGLRAPEREAAPLDQALQGRPVRLLRSVAMVTLTHTLQPTCYIQHATTNNNTTQTWLHANTVQPTCYINTLKCDTSMLHPTCYTTWYSI